ncbi:MAG: hypothetical protein ACQEVQ_03410 [Pseudomonadota bacterium]
MFLAALMKDKTDFDVVGPLEITSTVNRISDAPDDVLFICSSPDKTFLTKLIDAIKSVEVDLQSGEIPNVDDNSKGAYVYGYFEDAVPSWDKIFYVGKGNKNRDLSHTKNVLRKIKSGENLAGVKDKLIASYIKRMGINSEHQVRGTFVNRLYQHNDKYGNDIAFFIEYFLVHRARSPQRVSNKTEGNYKTGKHSALVRPVSYDPKKPQHSKLWGAAVTEFVTNPSSKRVSNTLRPSLKFIGFENSLDQINSKLAEVGLKPFNMSGLKENRLTPDTMIANNVSVSGAADPMISYINEAEDKPYRFDLRVKSGSSSTVINLRPLSCKEPDKKSFLEFFLALRLPEKVFNIQGKSLTTIPGDFLQNYAIKGLSDPLKNKNNWPFFKPMELTLKSKRASGVAFDFINFSETTACSPPWLKGEMHEMSFSQAVAAISKSF